MHVSYDKYHALFNDFIVVEGKESRVPQKKWGELAQKICHRRSGVGADGVLYLTSNAARRQVDIYNADGTWAEKSGNGLRIAALHEHLKDKRTKRFDLNMGDVDHCVSILKKSGAGYLARTSLGSPQFETAQIPVKSKSRYLINAPLKIGDVELPVTCLSVGNPHTVLLVDSFDFDWQTMGAEIETHRDFPNQTNVEFVKVVSRHKIQVADWERGAGATGSSGTGAAAAVCAGVVLGVVNRECEVVFETGSLHINWDEDTDEVALTGPVEYIASGDYLF